MAGKPFAAANSSSSVSIRQTSSSATTGSSTANPPAASGTRILRSPSHESVTTDLSLFSVSSLASDAAALRLAAPRGPSPCPEAPRTRPADIPEILWFEEENDVMRSCAALSAALGVHKSFSTSDICAAANSNPTCGVEPLGAQPRSAISELALSAIQRGGYFLGHPRLEHASRSCSTWVAVGDVASTSQLPSPHGGHAAVPPSAPSAMASSGGGLAPPAPTPAPPPSAPSFTAADLIRSVNKKVRQNYIRRRLLTTYKAIERLSQSEFNLDRLEVSASAAAAIAQAEADASHSTTTTQAAATNTSTESNAGPTTLHVPAKTTTSTSLLTTPAGPLVFDHQTTNAAVLRVVKQRAGKNLPLTIRDVERERGKPLSKYERNMMIFNWLHTLDNSTFEGLQ